MLGDREPVGHAGDIVGDGARALAVLRLGGPFGRHGGRVAQVGVKQAPHDRVRLLADPFNVRMPVHAGDEKGLDIAIGRLDGGRLPDQRPPGGGDRFRTRDPRFGNPPPALADCVLDEPGDHAASQLMDRARLLQAGMEIVDLTHHAVDKRNRRAKLREREQTGAQAVIDVVRVIGNIVSNRRRLRLEARMETQSSLCLSS